MKCKMLVVQVRENEQVSIFSRNQFSDLNNVQVRRLISVCLNHPVLIVISDYAQGQNPTISKSLRERLFNPTQKYHAGIYHTPANLL